MTATRKVGEAKCTVRTETVTLDCSGSITECCRMMLSSLPKEDRLALLTALQEAHQKCLVWEAGR